MNGSRGQVILMAGAIGSVAVGIAEDFRNKGAIVLIAPGGPCPAELSDLCSAYELVEGAVGQPSELALRCEEVATKHGRLDLVINCSGANPTPLTGTQQLSLKRAGTRTLLERLRELVAALV